MTFLKKSFLFGLVGLLLAGVPLLAWANSDNLVYVGPDEIIEGNFIKFNDVININGPINGDIIVAGESVEINGPVAGDVFVAATSVKITGDVEGSVRAIGQTVEITGAVGHNAWVLASKTLVVGPEATIGWDVAGAADVVTIKGAIAGGLNFAGSSFVIENEIAKDSTIDLDPDSKNILLDYGWVRRQRLPDGQISDKFKNSFIFLISCFENPILAVTSTTSSCGCTAPVHRDAGEGYFEISGEINATITGPSLSKTITVGFDQVGKKGTKVLKKQLVFVIKARFLDDE